MAVVSDRLLATGRRLARLATAGELVLFLGSGVSVGAGLPMWVPLVRQLAKAVGGPHPNVGAELVNALAADSWIPCETEESFCCAGEVDVEARRDCQGQSQLRRS